MNIFGVGPTELAVIFLIALVIAGPKRMLRWAYIMGQWAGKIRLLWADVAAEIQREVDKAGLDVEVPRQVPTRRSLDQMARKAMTPVSEPVRGALDELKFARDDAESALRDAAEKPTEKSAGKPADTPVDKPRPTAKPAPDGFGTWTNDAPSTPNTTTESADSDFGTWGG